MASRNFVQGNIRKLSTSTQAVAPVKVTQQRTYALRHFTTNFELKPSDKSRPVASFYNQTDIDSAAQKVRQCLQLKNLKKFGQFHATVDMRTKISNTSKLNKFGLI